MKGSTLWIALLVLASGCELLGESGEELRTELVAQDFSDIADPRARWEAYQLSSYTIVQTRSCFCSGPYSFEAEVRHGDVVQLRNTKPRREDGTINLELYMTIDEIFDMIEKQRQGSPARFEVSYHPRYGFPTRIHIDPNSEMADEEIIMTLRLEAHR